MAIATQHESPLASVETLVTTEEDSIAFSNSFIQVQGVHISRQENFTMKKIKSYGGLLE